MLTPLTSLLAALTLLAPRAAVSPTRFLVTFEHDAAQHARLLDELAEHRRLGERDAFLARLDLELDRQRARRAPLRAAVEAAGARVTGELWLTESLVVEAAGEHAYERLLGLPGVVAVEREEVRGPASLEVALDGSHHDTQGVNQGAVGGVPYDGAGVTIALIDTGVDVDVAGSGLPHKAFYEDADTTIDSGGIGGSRVLSFENKALFGGQLDDAHGHGTRMGSILAGAKYNNLPGVADGAAPGAFLRAYRIDDDLTPGLASTFGMAFAFDAAAAQPDVRVANLSFDGTAEPDVVPNPQIDAAARSGIVVTLSAGNDGAGSFFQGAFNALTVGASYVQTQAPFDDPGLFISPIGPLQDGRRYPRLLAVGEDLTSAVIDDETLAVGSYGTSGPAAIAAGTAALVLQAVPGSTALEVRALLLDTAEEVLLGDPHARGFGYLRAEEAVQAALAGLARTGFATAETRSTYRVTLAQDEPFTATLTWNRVWASGVPADLDLHLVGPDGTVVASSASGFDNVEQIRTAAPVAGDYELEVDVNDVEPGEFSLAFGLAASSPVVQTGLVDACAGSASFAVVPQFDVLPLPVGNFSPQFAIKGCGLASTTAVSVDGVPAAFVVKSDWLVVATVPGGLTPGTKPVSVTTSTATVGSSLTLGVAPPLLDMSYNVGPIQATLNYQLQAGPKEPYVLLGSTSLIPTSIPGLLELGIGNSGSNLFLTFGPAAVDSNGSTKEDLGLWQDNSPPIGLKIYFQAAVFSLTSMTLVPSNVDTTIVEPF